MLSHQPMPNTAKVRPVFTAERCRRPLIRLTDKWEDDYGSGDRYKSDYWHARRAFLSSYHLRLRGRDDDDDGGGFKEKMKRRLTEFNGATLVEFGDKVKRGMKEVNGVSRGVMAGLWRKAISFCNRSSHRRPMGRIRLGLPSGARPGFDCLAPWWFKLQLKAAGPY